MIVSSSVYFKKRKPIEFLAEMKVEKIWKLIIGQFDNSLGIQNENVYFPIVFFYLHSFIFIFFVNFEETWLILYQSSKLFVYIDCNIKAELVSSHRREKENALSWTYSSHGIRWKFTIKLRGCKLRRNETTFLKVSIFPFFHGINKSNLLFFCNAK